MAKRLGIPYAPQTTTLSLDQGGISDRLSNFGDFGDRIRDRDS